MSGRIFKLMLWAFPPWFREEHGEGMAELFHTRLERAHGFMGRLRVWARTGADMVRSAWAVRRWKREEDRMGAGDWRLDHVAKDLGHTLKRLWRAPAFTIGAVALLAVGLGANTTVFSLVDSLLFRPLPWGDADRVVYVYQDSDEGEPSSSSFPAYRDMVESDVFQAIGATSQDGATWERADGPVQVDIEYTTAGYMDALGLSPSRGRWFGPEHDQPGGAFVAVVSYPTWVSRFGADPGVVGTSVRLNGQPVTVIGVGPRGVPGSYPPFVTDFWLSISSTPIGGAFRVSNLDRRQDHWYDVRGRLAPGATVAQAQSAMDALALRLGDAFPDLERGRDITVYRARDIRAHPSADAQLFQAGTLLTAVVATVLLLACANLANLLLVRGLGRSGEMAVRRALGAGAGRVARLFFMESMVLSVLGGGLGVLFTVWAVRMIPTLPLPDVFPGLLELEVNGRVVLYSLALVVATGALFGLLPAIRAARVDVAGPLRDDRRGSSLGAASTRIRNALVSLQVGASLLLVLMTGLLVRSLATIQGTDPGVDADRVAWVRADLRQAAPPADRLVLLEELEERLRAIPGVTAVGSTNLLPAQGGGTTTTVVEGYEPESGTGAVELPFLVVTDDYFEAMGIELLAGRAFGPDDVPDGTFSVIVNETAARVFWGDEARAVGGRMRGQDGGAWRPVVGVVSDAPVRSLAEDVRPAFYFTVRQTGSPGVPYLVVRGEDPAGLLRTMRNEIQSVRSELAVDAQGTLTDYFGSTLAGPRFAATLLAAFSLLAVVLAGLGIYAVVAHGVARRAAELGIRLALGAGKDRVVGMVVRDVVGTVAVGLVGGLALSAFLAPRVASLMYGVEGADPIAFTVGAGFILTIAALAAWIPARRAASADPVEALRTS